MRLRCGLWGISGRRVRMLEIEIINATFENLSLTVDSFCLIKLGAKELARSSIIKGSLEPIWNEKFPQTLAELSLKEKV